jgi:hypothetical protein
MAEGVPIESGMVTRAIARAQKKVEDRNRGAQEPPRVRRGHGPAAPPDLQRGRRSSRRRARRRWCSRCSSAR